MAANSISTASSTDSAARCGWRGTGPGPQVVNLSSRRQESKQRTNFFTCLQYDRLSKTFLDWQEATKTMFASKDNSRNSLYVGYSLAYWLCVFTAYSSHNAEVSSILGISRGGGERGKSKIGPRAPLPPWSRHCVTHTPVVFFICADFMSNKGYIKIQSDSTTSLPSQHCWFLIWSVFSFLLIYRLPCCSQFTVKSPIQF